MIIDPLARSFENDVLVLQVLISALQVFISFVIFPVEVEKLYGQDDQNRNEKEISVEQKVFLKLNCQECRVNSCKFVYSKNSFVVIDGKQKRRIGIAV